MQERLEHDIPCGGIAVLNSIQEISLPLSVQRTGWGVKTFLGMSTYLK
jgi:hypothetical protein